MNFRLYIFFLQGFTGSSYLKEVSSEVVLVPESSVLVKAQFFLGVVAPTLLPFKLEFWRGDGDIQSVMGDTTVGYDYGVVTLATSCLCQAPWRLRQGLLVIG